MATHSAASASQGASSATEAQSASATAQGAALDAQAAANAAQDTFNTSIQPYADVIETLQVNSITHVETSVDGSAKTIQMIFRSGTGIVFDTVIDISVMFN